MSSANLLSLCEMKFPYPEYFRSFIKRKQIQTCLQSFMCTYLMPIISMKYSLYLRTHHHALGAFENPLDMFTAEGKGDKP